MSKTVKFGIIGCGAIADWHIKAIETLENAKLCAVADAFPEAAEKWGKKYNVTAYKSIDDLLLNSNADAVCICTPSGAHASLAIKALKANKYAIVEKPMAITKESLADLLKAEKQSTACLCPISQMRMIPDVIKARDIIKSGKLGTIVMADLSMKYYRSPEYYSQKPWRGTWAMDGGGALMNQGIHGLDMLRYLVGDLKIVSSMCKTLLHSIETEDTLCAQFETQNGGMGVITASTSVYPGFLRRLEVCGTKGSLVMEEGKLSSYKTLDGEQFDNNGELLSGSSDPSQIDFQPHIDQYKNITDHIVNGAELVLNSTEAAKTIQTIFDIYKI